MTEKITTDFYFINKDKETELFKNATLLNNFLFSKIDFYMLDAKTKYEICISKDGELFAIYCDSKKNYHTPQAFMSTFRNKFMDNNADEKMINKFLKKYKTKK